MGRKVAVIMGGNSFEREISLKSGRNVAYALESKGYDVLPLDADEHLVQTLRDEKPEAAYVAVHGAGGEDGTIPSLLEFLRIPYVGSRPPVCRTSWNKPDIPFVMQRAYHHDELSAIWPAECVLPAAAFRDLGAAGALDLIPQRIGTGFPLAVKPARGGSALGVSRVEKADQLGEAIMEALAYDDTVLVQEWVEGIEVSCGVLGADDGARVLPPVEIRPVSGLYDTEARLDPSRVEYYCPARPASLAAGPAAQDAALKQIERAALDVFKAFDCRDLARVDMIWDGVHVRVLDLKVSPGMTELSLLPKELAAAGMDFADVVAGLVEQAVARGC